MIKGHDAESINETVLLETWKHPGSNKIRPVFTEIDRVLLLCKQCSHGPCEIDYWVRDEANLTECKPQIPCCKKCPQWLCTPCCCERGGCKCGNPTTPPTKKCQIVFDASEIPDSFFTSGERTAFLLYVRDPTDHKKDFVTNPLLSWTGDMREDFYLSSPHGLGLALQNSYQEVLRHRIRYDNAKKIFVIFQDIENPEGRPFDPYLPWE